MGLRGPTATPTALRIVRGNPGHRPVNKREPQPRQKRPPAPEIVKADGAALKQYRLLVRLADSMNLLREPDGLPLGKLALLEAEYAKLTELVRETGFLVENKKSEMVHINPLLRRLDTILGQLWRGYREFGFSPAARASLQTEESPTNAAGSGESDWSDF